MNVLAPPPVDFAARLRLEAVAMRLSFRWLGVRRALTIDQKNRAVAPFDAESEFLTAGKRLFDMRHPTLRRLNQIRHVAIASFRHSSLPFPEPAIRLVRQRDLEPLTTRLTYLADDLAEAVDEFRTQYPSLKSGARQRLGDLFDENDYPSDPSSCFALTWDFPSTEPPDFLRRIAPELYESECRRVRARFEEAVALAEQSFLEEFSGLLDRLTERLDGTIDGRPKIFRDSAVGNLHDFFQRFRAMSVRSLPELDELVERADRLLRGVAPESLRSDQSLRHQVAGRLEAVQSELEALMVDRPRRRIVRD
ncbi:MAG TPA: hypothetical protein PLI18_06015 [Pirellulaceae bacterium]|nr:hypothetical protein [Pirellulaceae bacterium]